MASSSPPTPSAVRAAAGDAWFDALATDLRRLKAEGAGSVLVDVGNNSGGDDSGDWAVRLFTDRQVRLLAYNEQTSGAETTRVLAAAKQADIPVVPVTETLPSGKDYLSWMNANLDAVAGALAK